MPVFKRGSDRIYFAHVPKTAGLSIYTLFAQNEFLVSHLKLGGDPAAEVLRAKHGPRFLESTGRGSSKWSPQHATYPIWKKWGPFDSSFAIIRDPVERFVSAIKYRYLFTDGRMDISDFVERYARIAMRKSWRKPWLWGGHLMPQYKFIGPQTKVYWFSDDFTDRICDDFNLTAVLDRPVNVSSDFPIVLSSDVRSWLDKKYVKDFALIDKLGFRS